MLQANCDGAVRVAQVPSGNRRSQTAGSAPAGVWAYLLQKPNPWGGDNRPLYKLYASASNGECPIQIDTSTPSCGNSRFGCWTCTVVDRDRASEGLLASGDERMEMVLSQSG